MKVCTEKICYVINKINENKLSQIIFYENIENILLGNTNPPLFSTMVWKMKLCSLPQQANIDHAHQDLDKSSSGRRNQRTDKLCGKRLWKVVRWHRD